MPNFNNQQRSERRRWAFSYAHQLRQGLTIREIAEARGISRQAVEQVMANACPAFLEPPVKVEIVSLVLRQERRTALALNHERRQRNVVVLVPKTPPRPAWTKPDRALMHVVRQIGTEIRANRRKPGA